MAQTIYIVPVFSDNYCYWIVCPETKKAALVDCPDAATALAVLKKHDWNFSAILNTHHHWDHTGGNEELLRYKKVPVYGAGKIPASAGMTIGELEIKVLKVPGHTLDHVAFYFPSLKALFCGDTLFVGGCGRLFEGTAEQMFDSLQQIKNLPDDTQIYCGHEYTLKNLEFALTIEPDNEALLKKYEEAKEKRSRGEPTIPSTLAEEKQYNPFLRSKDAAQLTRRRKLKDSF